MPYIHPNRRSHLLRSSVSELMAEPKALHAGELNFVISTLLWSIFESDPCYSKANELLGVLSAATQEFYRRKVAPYEDLKIQQNGDL